MAPSATATAKSSSLSRRSTPTAGYVARLREELPRRFPDCTFYFQPADITSQILDFGLPAPIDVQVVGVHREENLKVAEKFSQEMAKIPGIADVHIHQITDYPTLRVDVDRVMASELGLTQQAVTGSVLVSLVGTTQVTPNYWVNPQNRINYVLAVQTPPNRVTTVDALMTRRSSTASPPPAKLVQPRVTWGSVIPGTPARAIRGSKSRTADAAATATAQQHIEPAPNGLRSGCEPLQRTTGVRGLRGRAGP